MYQRFTNKARMAVFAANEEAEKSWKRNVSTEHLLLALLHDTECSAYKLITELFAETSTALRNAIRAAALYEYGPPECENAPVNCDFSPTPRLKRVFDLAYDEARSLNNNYISTEHLLLGLLREADGIAGRVLAAANVDLTRARIFVSLGYNKGREE